MRQEGNRAMRKHTGRWGRVVAGATLLLLLLPLAADAAKGKKKKKKSGDLAQAIALYQAGQYNEAIGLLDTITQSESENSEAFFYLGMSHKGLDHYDPAVSNLQRAASLDADYFEARKEAGGYQFERRDYAAARGSLDAASQIKSNDATVEYQRGASAYLLNDYNGAKVPLEGAVQLNAAHPHSHYFLGLTYYQLRDFGRAIEQLSIFVQQAPEAPEAAQARQLLAALRN